MKFCIKCGNPLKPNARFCGKCGEVVMQVDKPIQPGPPETPVCISCGTELLPGIKFCTVCGARVDSPVQQVQLPQVFPPPPPIVTRAKKQRPAGPKRKLGKKSWIIAGSVFIVLAATVTALWFFNPHQSEPDEIIRPEYTVYPIVSGETTAETKKINVLAGSNAKVILSDSCSVVIAGLKSNASVELKKENNNIDLKKPGLKTSGYMLSVTYEGNDSIRFSQPVITIPRSQAGNVNPATINIVRVSDLVSADGSIVKDQIQYLPITLDKSGNYRAIDFMLPYTAFTIKGTARAGNIIEQIAGIFFPSALAEGTNSPKMAWVGHVRYAIMTFQDDFNWYKNPRLVQMTPDRSTGHFRHPATQPERLKRTAPVINIVVLVHGHNEEEKGGNVESMTNDLWEFEYKRDVWNYFYKYYLDQTSKTNAADPGRKDSCTLFYEFIYPSYRPAYSPVLNNSNLPYFTLGQDLCKDLNYELMKKNPQVAAMIKNNIPFNLFIVGHSMGGLVARAGIRYLDSRIMGNFRQLITWGSPHQGSPLTTLRYITAAGFNIRVADLALYTYGPLPGWAMQWSAMDTPGTRDLRWTNGSNTKENFFDYGKFFSAKSEEQDEDPSLSLQSGSAFYNDNLKKFNETEQFATKYTFLTGNTTHMAQVQKGNYMHTKAYYLYMGSDCAKGNYLINLMSAGDKFRPNDGASPVWGQGGMDLSPRPNTVDMGDMDHEQFYTDRGEETAAKTFEVMKDISNCDCPVLSDLKTNKGTVNATLVLPSDPKPGERIDKITVAVYDQQLKKSVNQSSDIVVTSSKGGFSGTYKLDKKYASRKDLMLRIVWKDGSIMEFPCSELDWNVFRKIYISCTLEHGNVRSIEEEPGRPDKTVDKTDTDGSMNFNIANASLDESSNFTPMNWNGNHFNVTAVYDYGGSHFETTITGEIKAVPLTEKPGPGKSAPPQDSGGVLGIENPHKISGTATKTETSSDGYKTIESIRFVDVPFFVLHDNVASFMIANPETYIVGTYVSDLKKEDITPFSIKKFFCSSAKGSVNILLKIK